MTSSLYQGIPESGAGPMGLFAPRICIMDMDHRKFETDVMLHTASWPIVPLHRFLQQMVMEPGQLVSNPDSPP